MDKARYKSLLFGYETRVSAIIGNGLVHGTPKFTVLKQGRAELERLGKALRLSSSDLSELWMGFKSRYYRTDAASRATLRKVKSGDYKKDLFDKQDIVYEQLKKDFKYSEHEKNELANKMEFRIKKEGLDELLSDGNVFYVCSTHEHPAKDHEDWEGKIYCSEDWEIRAGRRAPEVERYIKENDVRTVEWVTGAPVYLIYRPNCRHFFTPVSIDAVLSGKAKPVIMKTKNPSTERYRRYKFYAEREKYLVELSRMAPSRAINKDIKQTRKLKLKQKKQNK